MRKLLVVVLFLNIILIAKGQNLTVEGSAPDLYISHIVAPKENFYSIGRLYNQSPKAIAAFNNIIMEKGLTIGQHVKIPLNAQNFDANDNTKGEIPLTHVITKSESLFKIAKDNNVTAKQIRKWNNLSSDHIAVGTPLVIGHLKMNSSSVSTPKSTATPVAKSEPVVTSEQAETAQSKQNSTSEKNAGSSVSTGNTTEQGKTEKVAKENSAENSSNESEQNTSANSSDSASGKDTALAVIPNKPAEAANAATPAKETAAKQPEASTAKADESRKAETSDELSNSTEGAFASLFPTQAAQKSLNTKSGEAGTFKSTSGWQDKKYYVLMSNVAPGTILKISSSENKVVYAKVLGSMPEMKENEGLLLRISNSAASYLGIIDPKFPVEVSYYQ